MFPFCFRKLLWTGCFLLLWPSFALVAQPITPVTYSLPALIDSAQRHLPVLRQKQALVDAAKAGIRDAKDAYLPASWLGDEVLVGSDNSLPGTYYSFGLIPSTSSGVNPANNSQAAGGNMAFLFNEYDLVTFGLRRATVRRAEAGEHLSQADLDRELYLIKWQIARLYLNIRKSQLQLGIDSENVNRYSELYTVIRAVTQSGIKPGADSALAMAELSGARTAYNNTYGQGRQLYEELGYFTGLPSGGITVDTSRIRGNLGAKRVGGVSLDLSSPDSTSVPNPLIEYFAREQDLYRQTENLVKKSYLPKIMLTGVTWARGSSINYQGKYGGVTDGWGYQRYNYLAGLTVTYNLFDLVHRRDKEAIARNETAASEFGLQQEQLELQNVGSKADQGILTAVKNLAELPIQIAAAQAAFSQKTAQYKAGIINLVDLAEASFVLYRAESDYVSAISDWLSYNLDRAAANGNLDLFIQTIQ
ncbi:MAG TPA: TolC family protein [Puia sp.]|jgi:outer membrane protein TolC|nr:TolC family protein [Puia sp.]